MGMPFTRKSTTISRIASPLKQAAGSKGKKQARIKLLKWELNLEQEQAG